MLSLFHSLSLYLSLFISLFSLSDVFFNKRVKQDSTATPRKAVNRSKPNATNSRFTMMCVDNLSQYKAVAFMAKESDATAVLRAIIDRYFASTGLNIGVILTDNGGEFQRAFQSLFSGLGIKHERTPPYTPQYSGVAKWTLGLLRDVTVALLRGGTEGESERLWAEAMAYA